jgi:hypothetical protein
MKKNRVCAKHTTWNELTHHDKLTIPHAVSEPLRRACWNWNSCKTLSLLWTNFLHKCGTTRSIAINLIAAYVFAAISVQQIDSNDALCGA